MLLPSNFFEIKRNFVDLTGEERRVGATGDLEIAPFFLKKPRGADATGASVATVATVATVASGASGASRAAGSSGAGAGASGASPAATAPPPLPVLVVNHATPPHEVRAFIARLAQPALGPAAAGKFASCIGIGTSAFATGAAAAAAAVASLAPVRATNGGGGAFLQLARGVDLVYDGASAHFAYWMQEPVADALGKPSSPPKGKPVPDGGNLFGLTSVAHSTLNFFHLLQAFTPAEQRLISYGNASPVPVSHEDRTRLGKLRGDDFAAACAVSIGWHVRAGLRVIALGGNECDAAVNKHLAMARFWLDARFDIVLGAARVEHTVRVADFGGGVVLAAIGDMPHGMGGFAAERAKLATGMLLGGLLAREPFSPASLERVRDAKYLGGHFNSGAGGAGDLRLLGANAEVAAAAAEGSVARIEAAAAARVRVLAAVKVSAARRSEAMKGNGASERCRARRV